MPNEKTDHKAVKLNNILADLNLHQTVKKAIQGYQYVYTPIDHIYVSSNISNISECSVPCYAISDHYPFCVTW